MTSLFSTDKQIEIDKIKDAYDTLSQQFRADLYVTSQGRPLLSAES